MLAASPGTLCVRASLISCAVGACATVTYYIHGVPPEALAQAPTPFPLDVSLPVPLNVAHLLGRTRIG